MENNFLNFDSEVFKGTLAFMMLIFAAGTAFIMLSDRRFADDFSLAELEDQRIARLVGLSEMPEKRVRLILATIVGGNARRCLALSDEQIVALLLVHPLSRSTIGSSDPSVSPT